MSLNKIDGTLHTIFNFLRNLHKIHLCVAAKITLDERTLEC